MAKRPRHYARNVDRATPESFNAQVERIMHGDIPPIDELLAAGPTAASRPVPPHHHPGFDNLPAADRAVYLACGEILRAWYDEAAAPEKAKRIRKAVRRALARL